MFCMISELKYNDCQTEKTPHKTSIRTMSVKGPSLYQRGANLAFSDTTFWNLVILTVSSLVKVVQLGCGFELCGPG